MICCSLVFFLLEHDAEKCLIRATISGQLKIAFSAVFSLNHRAPQNRCGNFQESCSLCPIEQETQSFQHYFHDFVNFPITCLDTSFYRPWYNMQAATTYLSKFWFIIFFPCCNEFSEHFPVCIRAIHWKLVHICFWNGLQYLLFINTNFLGLLDTWTGNQNTLF